jgi:hypothetical protein
MLQVHLRLHLHLAPLAQLTVWQLEQIPHIQVLPPHLRAQKDEQGLAPLQLQHRRRYQDIRVRAPPRTRDKPEPADSPVTIRTRSSKVSLPRRNSCIGQVVIADEQLMLARGISAENLLPLDEEPGAEISLEIPTTRSKLSLRAI